MLDDLSNIQAGIRYAVLDQGRERLIRYRPDLRDLIDWAFSENRDALLVPAPDERHVN